MTKWSDAEFTLTIPEADLTAADEIHVTIAQGRHVVDIDTPTVLGAHEMQVQLTQQQTSGFALSAAAEMQVNFMVGGIRRNTDIVTVPVLGNLLEKVIGNE